MNRKVKNQIFLCLGLFMAIINGCKKGETGPAGPEGKPGSANISSNTYSVASWPYSSPYYYCDLATSAITSTNVNSAAVMVYFSTGGNVWHALPYTQYNSPYDYFMGFNTSVGNVQVTWFYDSSLSTGSSPNTYYGTTVQVKVVVIPPAMIKKNVDIRNYAEMKTAYKLND